MLEGRNNNEAWRDEIVGLSAEGRGRDDNGEKSTLLEKLLAQQAELLACCVLTCGSQISGKSVL